MSADNGHQVEELLVERGRREGYAFSALALSLVSFVNLLGIEKSALAVVLAVFAMRGATDAFTRKRGAIAIMLASLQVVTIVLVLVLARDRVAHLIELLRQLG